MKEHHAGRHKFRHATASTLCFFLCGLSANARAYNCVDYVGHVSTNRGNEVLMESFAGSSWIMLCSLTSTVNSVTPENCKAVFAQLLAAQLAGKKVRLWFNDNDGRTCSTQPSWTYATGWYFGPDVLD
jgi:hypothetical protein